MLYPETTPQQSILSTPIDLVLDSLNNLVSAYLAVTGCHPPLMNSSVELLSTSLVRHPETARWFRDYYCAGRELMYGFNDHATSAFINKAIREVRELRDLDLSKIPYTYVTSDYLDDKPSPFNNNDYAHIIEKHNLVKTDNTTLSRAIIILMDPCYEDFVFGAPAWLRYTTGNALTAYDEDNRRHIKIDIEKDRFKYYTSIISDNWKEIKDVPPEIDKIVNYLISPKKS